jgi:predicted outer membrane protein
MILHRGTRHAIVLLAAAAAALACAKEPPPLHPATPHRVPAASGGDIALSPVVVVTMPLSDANILAALHELDTAEVLTGHVASTRAIRSDVRAYAQDMVASHRQLDSAARALAGALEISPHLADSTLVYLRRAQLDGLESRPTSAFDATYMSQQVSAHRRALAVLDSAIKSVDLPELKAMLRSQARPRFARELARAVSATTL